MALTQTSQVSSNALAAGNGNRGADMAGRTRQPSDEGFVDFNHVHRPHVRGAGSHYTGKAAEAVSFLEGIASSLGAGAKVYYAAGLPTLDEMAERTKFTTEAGGGTPGLKAEFYDNASLSGQPGIQRIDKKASFDPGATGGMAANDVSIRWTGYFTPRSPGETWDQSMSHTTILPLALPPAARIPSGAQATLTIGPMPKS